MQVTAAIGVLMRLHPGAGLHVTGHSMGAAIAEICALDAKFKFRIATVSFVTLCGPAGSSFTLCAAAVLSMIQGPSLISRSLCPTLCRCVPSRLALPEWATAHSTISLSRRPRAAGGLRTAVTWCRPCLPHVGRKPYRYFWLMPVPAPLPAPPRSQHVSDPGNVFPFILMRMRDRWCSRPLRPRELGRVIYRYGVELAA